MQRSVRRELASLGLGSPWTLLQAIRNFARTVWDPTRSDIRGGINHLIAEALRNAPPEQVERMERERPELAQLYAEAYDPALDRRALEAFPDGSFGREYARFIRDNGIDPLATLLEIGAPRNLLHYLFRRAYKLHDLMHVALGCDASVLGEVRIVSYSLGQSLADAGRASRAPALALAVLMLHLALRKPADVAEAVRLAAEWLRLGERARAHVTIRLEDHLEAPVSAVRAMVFAGAEGA